MSGLTLNLILISGCLVNVVAIGLIVYVVSAAKPGPNSPFQQKWAITLSLLILVLSLGCVGALLYLAR